MRCPFCKEYRFIYAEYSGYGDYGDIIICRCRNCGEVAYDIASGYWEEVENVRRRNVEENAWKVENQMKGYKRCFCTEGIVLWSVWVPNRRNWHKLGERYLDENTDPDLDFREWLINFEGCKPYRGKTGCDL